MAIKIDGAGKDAVTMDQAKLCRATISDACPEPEADAKQDVIRDALYRLWSDGSDLLFNQPGDAWGRALDQAEKVLGKHPPHRGTFEVVPRIEPRSEACGLPYGACPGMHRGSGTCPECGEYVASVTPSPPVSSGGDRPGQADAAVAEAWGAGPLAKLFVDFDGDGQWSVFVKLRDGQYRTFQPAPPTDAPSEGTGEEPQKATPQQEAILNKMVRGPLGLPLSKRAALSGAPPTPAPRPRIDPAQVRRKADVIRAGKTEGWGLLFTEDEALWLDLDDAYRAAGDVASKSAVDREGGESDAAFARKLSSLCEPWSYSNGPLPDYESPLTGVFCSGMAYTEQLLANVLDVKNYEGGDGSEDFDCDATKTLTNILTEAGIWDRDEECLLARRATSTRHEGEVTEAVLRVVEDEYASMSGKRCSTERARIFAQNVLETARAAPTDKVAS